MHLDNLERLINEAADPSAFRELSLRYLKLAGYHTVELTDGRGDGGKDFRLFKLGGNPEPLAVQVSVQKKRWQAKLRADAVRAKEIFGTSNFTYLTSHRISGQDEQEVANELWSSHNIALRVIDAQAIASMFVTENKTSQVLDALGVYSRESAYGERGKPANVKEDLAYAYAFFGTDVDGFRQTAIARSIAAFVTNEYENPPTREVVIESLSSALGLAEGRKSLISGQIDHMLQRGELLLHDQTLTASDAIAESNRTVRVLRGRQWRDLQEGISERLGNAGITGRKLEQLTEDISEAAGFLMLKSAMTAKAALEPGGDMGPAKRQIEVSLQRIERALTDAGVEPDQTSALLTDLSALISHSEIGQTLLAGHLFLSLLDMSVGDLLRALGGHETLEVFLDASVAIPMIAGLLYEPHETPFFQTAHHAYEQARKYGVSLRLPLDYLEEAASHLLDAYRDYRPVIEIGEDLRFSQNAFVAHYSALKRAGKYEGTFAQYAAAFGLRESADSAPRRVERNWIMDRLRAEFARYHITVVDPKTVSSEAMANAEKAISFTARELGVERSPRLLEHDARAIAEITSRAAVGSAAMMFCTKDRLHLQLSTAEGAVDWHAVDPSMLADLLALASSEPDEPVSVAVDVALGLSEAEARRGADIWDALVKIEKESLYDADALQRAKAFKDGYLANLQSEAKSEPVAVAWENWRAEADAG